MADRVSFSNAHQSLEEIANHHEDLKLALFEFFSGSSPRALSRHAHSNLLVERDLRLLELDRSSSMALMSSVEARIRIDYLMRVYGRRRDPLSRSMRTLHQLKGNRSGLERDILPLWKSSSISRILVGELTGAFGYRHWLAHGRYWTPKWGRNYDYLTIYDICSEFVDAMDAA